jgi:hypothetical protein
VRLEGSGKLNKSNDHIGIRTRVRLACSIVPQPSTLPRVPFLCSVDVQIERYLDWPNLPEIGKNMVTELLKIPDDP